MKANLELDDMIIVKKRELAKMDLYRELLIMSMLCLSKISLTALEKFSPKEVGYLNLQTIERDNEYS